MEFPVNIWLENRYVRHAAFWIAWIISFTFIKSFGSGLESYAGWLCYYLLTLPVFMAHTYLLVYWAAEKLMKGWKILLFILVFVVLMIFFSFIEMYLTSRILSPAFPGVFSGDLDYTNPVNLLISGIGNLYIILVFAAARMIRSGYMTENRRKQLMQKNLFIERADANAGIQPGMLLFSVKSIEKLGSDHPEEVPAAIAMLSELLNAVMQAHQLMVLRLDEEIRNVRSMLKLYALLMLREMPLLKIEQCAQSVPGIPAFMIFSPLEIIIRQYKWLPEDSIEVCIREKGEVTIAWEKKRNAAPLPAAESLETELDLLYPGRYRVRMEEERQKHILRIRESDGWKNESHLQTYPGSWSAG